LKQILTPEQLEAGIERLAAEVAAHYAGRTLTVVAVLTGSIVIVADLIRRLDLPLRVGLVQARSYRGGATRPGELVINDALLPDIRDRDVLLVDDIFDTGRTLATLHAQMQALEPRSLRTAVLLRKIGRQVVDFEPDHVVFPIPDVFVVGYGLDYCDAYRNLPYVAALDEADLEPGRWK
jgi:hypoxanthine phosphoribosyltransferase